MIPSWLSIVFANLPALIQVGMKVEQGIELLVKVIADAHGMTEEEYQQARVDTKKLLDVATAAVLAQKLPPHS